jgi:hypothetical protein
MLRYYKVLSELEQVEQKFYQQIKYKKWKNQIKTKGANLQELYYQNTRTELLSKGQKTTLELSHITATNAGIEANLIFQINALLEQIKQLTTQMKQ